MTATRLKIPKPIKYLFFSELKSQEDIVELEKEMGEIVELVMTIKKDNCKLTALNAKGEKEEVKIEDSKMKAFLKRLGVKEGSVDECKTIFVSIDLKKKFMFITKNKLDGTKEELVI